MICKPLINKVSCGSLQQLQLSVQPSSLSVLMPHVFRVVTGSSSLTSGDINSTCIHSLQTYKYHSLNLNLTLTTELSRIPNWTTQPEWSGFKSDVDAGFNITFQSLTILFCGLYTCTWLITPPSVSNPFGPCRAHVCVESAVWGVSLRYDIHTSGRQLKFEMFIAAAVHS